MSTFFGDFGLRLHQEYSYTGTRQELEKRVAQLASANVESLTNGDYKLRPDISFGTAIMKGAPGMIDGINVTMKIISKSTNEQLIIFTTNIRPEHFLTTALLLFFGLISYFSRNSSHFFDLPELALIGLAMYLWFHLLLRFQEQRVVNKTAKELQLLEITSQ